MKQIQLDGYSNYILHQLGDKGGPLPIIDIKRDIAKRGKTEGEAFLLIDAMREKGLVALVGNTHVELTAKGKELYPPKRE
ncbi:MAG: hypothetical protein KGH65_03505 [Candidatus Micrarchaeota archaeon]|nr:hypothetical protein [Candidatus Micrarchaeota archaeon]